MTELTRKHIEQLQREAFTPGRTIMGIRQDWMLALCDLALEALNQREQGEWQPKIGDPVAVVGQYKQDWRADSPVIAGMMQDQTVDGGVNYSIIVDGEGPTDGFSRVELELRPTPPAKEPSDDQ